MTLDLRGEWIVTGMLRVNNYPIPVRYTRVTLDVDYLDDNEDDDAGTISLKKVEVMPLNGAEDNDGYAYVFVDDEEDK